MATLRFGGAAQEVDPDEWTTTETEVTFELRSPMFYFEYMTVGSTIADVLRNNPHVRHVRFIFDNQTWDPDSNLEVADELRGRERVTILVRGVDVTRFVRRVYGILPRDRVVYRAYGEEGGNLGAGIHMGPTEAAAALTRWMRQREGEVARHAPDELLRLIFSEHLFRPDQRPRR